MARSFSGISLPLNAGRVANPTLPRLYMDEKANIGCGFG